MKLGRPWWTMSPVGVADYGEADSTDNAGGAVLDDEVLTLDYAPAPTPRGDMEAIGAVMSDIRKRVESGGRVVFAAPTPAVVARMVRRFKEAGIAVEPIGVDLTGSRGLGRLPKPKHTTADEPARIKSASITRCATRPRFSIRRR